MIIRTHIIAQELSVDNKIINDMANKLGIRKSKLKNDGKPQYHYILEEDHSKLVDAITNRNSKPIEDHLNLVKNKISKSNSTKTTISSNKINIAETIQTIQDNFYKKFPHLFNKKTITKEIVELKKSLSKEEFIEYIKTDKSLTLKNIEVKSNGEKWIADFLFEHNIKFEYEETVLWNKSLYRPDFYIYPNFYLEHWGIDENDKNQETPKHWTKSFAEYKNEMNRKREFWENRKEILLETSSVDLRNGKNEFEKILKDKLEAVGIEVKKLSIDETYNKLEY